MSWDIPKSVRRELLAHLSEKSIDHLAFIWKRDNVAELTDVQFKYLLNQYELDKDDYYLYSEFKVAEQRLRVSRNVLFTLVAVIVGYFVLNAIL